MIKLKYIYIYEGLNLKKKQVKKHKTLWNEYFFVGVTTMIRSYHLVFC